MVHFMESISNKKPSLTIMDKEDDPIAEGVTVRVDVPTPQPFRDFLLDNRLTDSCWSVESTRDIQSSDGVITSMRILKLGSPLFASSIPSQEASPLLHHRIIDGTLSWGNFFTLLFRQLFHTELLGMA